jgi:hypothetical protein
MNNLISKLMAVANVNDYKVEKGRNSQSKQNFYSFSKALACTLLPRIN